MTVQVYAKSSEQKPRYNLDMKKLIPGELRSLERSSLLRSRCLGLRGRLGTLQRFQISPKNATTEEKVGSMYQFY